MVPASVAGSEQDPKPAFDHSSPWLDAFANVPGIGVEILTSEGRCVYANPYSVQIFRGHSRPDVSIGRHLTDLFPPAWVDERLALLKEITTHHRPIVVRSIWRGKRVESTLRWLGWDGKAGNAEAGRILVVSRTHAALSTATTQDAQIVWSEVAELGELDVLSPRELEVLALLAQGISYEDIARSLKRSRKTIDNHRQAIGRKLNVCDRVTLARIASEAGLELRDATSKRVRFHLLPGELSLLGNSTETSRPQGTSGHESRPLNTMS